MTNDRRCTACTRVLFMRIRSVISYHNSGCVIEKQTNVETINWCNIDNRGTDDNSVLQHVQTHDIVINDGGDHQGQCRNTCIHSYAPMRTCTYAHVYI